tara:strand:- start:549 stop:776 length:228 start_codon:yes stop_codon:yes gene_type:complete
MLKPLTASFVYMNTEERMLRMMKSFDEVGLDSNMVEINHLYLHDNEIGIYGGEIMSPLVKHAYDEINRTCDEYRV